MMFGSGLTTSPSSESPLIASRGSAKATAVHLWRCSPLARSAFWIAVFTAGRCKVLEAIDRAVLGL